MERIYERLPNGVPDDRRRQGNHINHGCISSISLVFSILVLGIVLCYPAALAIGTNIPLVSISEPVPPECIPTIGDSDIDTFLNYITVGKSRLMYVHLTVDMDNVCDNCSAFNPNSWVWVSADTIEVSTFLNWQEDYAIWSFGILDMYATRDVNIALNVSSSCQTEKFGKAGYMEAIAAKLNNMTAIGLSHMKEDYNESMWCYRTKLNTLTNTEKHFVRNFRYFVQDLGTICFKLENNKRIYESPNRFWTNIPFSITYIAFLFSPLLYVYLLHFLFNKSPVPWLSWGGDPSEGVPPDDTYVFQRFKSPVTFSSILLEVVTSKVCDSLMLQLVTKICVLLLSPVIIYIKVLIYHINFDFKFLLEKQIDHGISIGFSSMLFNFDQKSKNFLTFTGGPCIMLLIYYVLGTGLILSYHLLSPDIKYEENQNESVIPLSSLHLDTMKSTNNDTLKNKLLNIVAENSVKHSFSPSFFKHIWNTDRIWQMPFSVVFHQTPFLFMSHLALQSNMICIAEKCRQQRGLGIGLCIIYGITHFMFLFAFATIFFASFEFLVLIVTYCYIAMVTYPTESAGYFLFAMSALYYFCRCLRDIAQKYQHLLILSVEVSKELETEALLLDRNNQLPHPEYLRHGQLSLGIPKRLFEKIVDKYEPKASTIKIALVKIVSVTCMLAWTLKLVISLHESHDIGSLVSLFSAFLAVSLPNLIWLLTRDFSQETRNIICKIHLYNFIENYWRGE